MGIRFESFWAIFKIIHYLTFREHKILYVNYFMHFMHTYKKYAIQSSYNNIWDSKLTNCFETVWTSSALKTRQATQKKTTPTFSATKGTLNLGACISVARSSVLAAKPRQAWGRGGKDPWGFPGLVVEANPCGNIWVFPKIGKHPQNGWFIWFRMEIPIKMDDWGYHHFRKHPYAQSLFWENLLKLSEIQK